MAGALTEMFVFAPFEAGSRISWWLGYVVIALLTVRLSRGGLAVRSVAIVRARSSHVDSVESGGVHLSWSSSRLRTLFHLVVADLPVSVSRVAFFSALADRMVVGGVACTVACYFKHSEQPRPSSNQTLQPTAGRLMRSFFLTSAFNFVPTLSAASGG